MARPTTQRDFEAQSDARNLAESAAIRSDKPRMGRAAKAATRMAKEEQAKATALKSIARPAKAKPPTRRNTRVAGSRRRKP